MTMENIKIIEADFPSLKLCVCLHLKQTGAAQQKQNMRIIVSFERSGLCDMHVNCLKSTARL